MDAALRKLVWERAGSRCEYCRLPQRLDRPRFEVEHVLPEKHGGPTVAENLALACFFCNRFKGPNLSGIDPVTRLVRQLFNPRRNVWREHFYWDGSWLRGFTPEGRATIVVLRINDSPRVAFRELLTESGDADWLTAE
jgi:hypothetical protein